MRVTRKSLLVVLLVTVALGLAVLYTEGASRHSQVVNTSLENTDQGSYLEYIVNMRETRYGYVGGRNQMPLYNFLQSLVYDPQGTADEAFSRGKAFNIALSIVLLGALFLVWRRHFPLVQASALLLVTAFAVFIFKAAYIQAELLYYVLAFGAFLLFCRLLEAPSWHLAVITGVWLGLTHLTKASVLPALALYLVAGLLRAAWLTARTVRQKPDASAGRIVGRELSLLGLVTLAFLVTVSPYLITSRRVFGHAFYNVNSTFYMWYDRWSQAMHGTIPHGDRIGWPSLPPDQLPSATKYLREHTVADIAARIGDGLKFLFGSGVRTYGYWKYVLFYGAVAMVLLGIHWQWGVGLLRRHPFVGLFVTGYFLAYSLLYAWYVPVARGNRLVLSLFLPFMFAVGWLLTARARADRLGEGRWPHWYTAVHLVMIGGILLELHDILTRRIVTVYGGG
ncbi:MAG: hypothetical protein ACREOC_17230 [Gemmatimonadales bacterium]